MSAPSLEDTIAFAVARYARHPPDLGGAPYVLHPLRVMAAMLTDEERRVAVMHDLVEDCGVTLDDLRLMKYPEREVVAVDALTRRKALGESYEAFISRLRTNDLARRVKLADLADNMDVRRLREVDERARERLERYREAWRMLANVAPEAPLSPGPQNVRQSDVWRAFERDLADTLGVLQRDYCLIIAGKGCNRFVQFAVGESDLRAEAVSNQYLEQGERLGEDATAALQRMGWNPPTAKPGERGPVGGSPNFFRDFVPPIRTGDAARAAVQTLKEIFRIPHPDQLEYRAFHWPTGEQILLPTLHVTRTQPPPRPPERGQGYEEVRALVRSALRKFSGNDEADFDDSGNIAIRFGSALVYVHVFKSPLFVRAYSPVLANVEQPGEVLNRLNELNRGATFVRFLFLDGTIFASADVFAHPFVAEHALHACRVVGEVADDMDEALQAQFGGRTSFGEFRAAGLKN